MGITSVMRCSIGSGEGSTTIYIDPHEIEGYCIVCGRPICIDDWRGVVPQGMVCEICVDNYDDFEED